MQNVTANAPATANTSKPAASAAKPAAKPATKPEGKKATAPKKDGKKAAKKPAKEKAPKAPPIMKIGAGKVEKNVPLAKIVADESKMQAREKISEPKAKEYATLMKDGIKFPPIEVFEKGDQYILADGFHRLHALKANGDVTVTVKVLPGGETEALFHSLGANSTHGLARSNGDKKKAVHTFLTHPDFSKFSDRDIAKHIGVSNVMVSKYRKTLKRNSGEGEGEDSGKGSKGGRLRAELTDAQADSLDETISKLRNELVACSKKLGERDQDFLRRLFNAEIKLMVADTAMGKTTDRKVHPNNQAKKDAAKK